MLRVLLDRHRARMRVKRGEDPLRVTLTGMGSTATEEPSVLIPAFAEALEELERVDSRSAEVTKLRVLWGLNLPEIAETLELSLRTVEREWRFARTWLAVQLDLEDPAN